MARNRLLVETSDQMKSALLEAVDTQDLTLTDWLEEQIASSVPRARRSVREGAEVLMQPAELAEPNRVLRRLTEQDWAFKDDDTRYLTHDLHPYPAKFIPQIPANLISSLSLRGDLIFDPFGGSATTAVEAVRLGRRSVSMDANPLSAIMGRVKTGYMTPDIRTDLEQLLAAVEGHILSHEADGADWGASLMLKYASQIPVIPNLSKWFSDSATGELALLRFLIEQTTHGLARDSALLALSRIVLRVSYQDSETRYVAVAKDVPPTFTLRAFLETERRIMRRLELAARDFQYADAHFLIGDSRRAILANVGENSVDLIVTSPPYPNATDYHLYHRFRMYWLGFDPKTLGDVEIGSHLKHQRDGSDFESYRDDMSSVVEHCARVLRPGRYAVFVVGDAMFKGEVFSTASALGELASRHGLDVIGVIERALHNTKRSFAAPARRARSEHLVILHKPDRPLDIWLAPPMYKMWSYEKTLRRMEISALTGKSIPTESSGDEVMVELRQAELWNARRLTFTSRYATDGLFANSQSTWQKVLENGDSESKARKDPKYVTHGIHAYKGKFYPQLAKVLLNISQVPLGARVFDPFCGSGTLLLEGMLNGFETFGSDLNPLAAKVARAKTGILCLPREVVDLAIRSLVDRLRGRDNKLRSSREQFADATLEELDRWFPEPVLDKVNWLLLQIRLLGNPVLIDFLEVLLSSIIREVSQQEPTDLRIRRRKVALADAPVFELFVTRLVDQHSRLKKFWQVAGRQPGPMFAPRIVEGDSRQASVLSSLGIGSRSIDAVITSPPYATALPYIDTDRLSLLAVMGLSSSFRTSLEDRLTGSREISRVERERLECELHSPTAYETLPRSVVRSIRKIHAANAAGDVGFRRVNMASLLWRYFQDMRQNLANVSRILRSGATAWYVVGDSRTQAGEDWTAIETTKHIADIGEMVGLVPTSRTSIDVTTENYKHIRNAITKNEIIQFIQP
jgi:DNA modification methylase